MADPAIWVAGYTQTYNEHWQEEGRPGPLEPFPRYPYFLDVFGVMDLDRIVWWEKSRDMMLSWACVAYLTHAAMKTPYCGILFQTQKDDKVIQLVDYAKQLYRNSDSRIQAAWPLSKPLDRQSDHELNFANGSYIIGIPGGADQIRSYHPWGYLNDESSFQPDAGQCYNEALSAVKGKIIFNSSAGPGWYADARRDIVRNEEDGTAGGRTLFDPKKKPIAGFATVTDAYARLRELGPQTPAELPHGGLLRLTKGGIPVGRLHYSAHPERDPLTHPEWKIAERKTYTSQASWDREQEIIDEAGGGELVFADVLLTHWSKIVITDPRWQPDPEWRCDGGFDHGKTNPTTLIRCYTDFEGTHYYCGEYYQPGKLIWEHAQSILKMADYERMEYIMGDPSVFWTGQQQSGDRPGHSQEKIKSLCELYDEGGITKLVQAPGDRSDVSFAERLHRHWANLDEREPTVKIVCRNYAEGFQPGLHNWDCPNLLWELMTARRVQLSAHQLLKRNVSEAIVDKDNHARDAMKYHLMSWPEPARKPLERRVAERIQQIFKNGIAEGTADPGTISDMAATTALVQYTQIQHEEAEEEEYQPTYYGRNARHLIRQIERRRRGRLS